MYQNAVWHALRQMQLTHKKNLKIQRARPKKAMRYLRALRAAIAERRPQNIVYVDESGFEPNSLRPHGWGKRGQIVFGERSDHRRPRNSLIAAHRKNVFIAPIIFKGTANIELVNAWFEQMLMLELRPNSTIILDNAAFHNKAQLTQIDHKYGHYIMFLPPYSPDFNPIEKDFGNIKKMRQFTPPNTPIENIIKSYKNYLV